MKFKKRLFADIKKELDLLNYFFRYIQLLTKEINLNLIKIEILTLILARSLSEYQENKK